jgi:hypothetical protein
MHPRFSRKHFDFYLQGESITERAIGNVTAANLASGDDGFEAAADPLQKGEPELVHGIHQYRLESCRRMLRAERVQLLGAICRARAKGVSQLAVLNGGSRTLQEHANLDHFLLRRQNLEA